ncbi:MAG: type II toxin-antitoxin system prevent-host-death family antitoxin [Planctomycetota bacterium]|nr:type II toxin-antitoxin system prevent-host-death family antitoxin [Planctomycetota bacterium]
MQKANIAEFKSRLSQYMSLVENGEEVEICRRNIPFARVVPLSQTKENRTQLGCDQGSVEVKVDLAEPTIPEHDWEMLEDDA